jgi:hypothetical protein
MRNSRQFDKLCESNDWHRVPDRATPREVAVAADEPADEAEVSSVPEARSALWEDVRIDPVEIALPSGVGYTLRAYRPPADLAGGDTEDDESDKLDDFDAASAAVARQRRAEREAGEDDDEDDELDEFEDELDEDELDDEDDDQLDENDEAEQPDEVPVFLGRGGKVYLFHSADKLVEYVRSGAENDLSQLDTWPELVKRISVDDVVPADEDTYELDLIVENLRGGADAWDATLIIKAGEIARDLGHALRIEPVQVALAPGSPLDDFDEALRSAASGGIGSFFARRKLRKVSSQQATLSWRTVIGKISSAADWRD